MSWNAPGNGQEPYRVAYNDAKDFQDVPLGRGKFQVFRRAPQEEGGGIIYGISDEESRLNLNTASPNQLTNLAGMTTDILGAIMCLAQPRCQDTAQAANQDPATRAEPIRIITCPSGRRIWRATALSKPCGSCSWCAASPPRLLLGNDDNQNGFLDSDDDPADQGPPGSKPPPPPNPGWAALLTVTDTDKDVDASGKDRVNPQTADEATLLTVPGITRTLPGRLSPTAARTSCKVWTIFFPSRRKIKPRRRTEMPEAGANQPGNQNGSGNSGSPVISQDLLEQIADGLTLASGTDLPGLININTASLDVLICLPGVDGPGAGDHQLSKSTGYFDNVAGTSEGGRDDARHFQASGSAGHGPLRNLPHYLRGKNQFLGRAPAHRGHCPHWPQRHRNPWLPGGLMKRLESTNAAGLFIDIGQSSFQGGPRRRRLCLSP
jgi:DNA uptake protein ComE-like DNA-binding protein